MYKWLFCVANEYDIIKLLKQRKKVGNRVAVDDTIVTLTIKIHHLWSFLEAS